MQGLQVEGLAYAYGSGGPAAEAAAVNDVRFELESGRFLCLLGPSGCGKTTLLRLIGGYLAPSAGRIALGGTDIGRLPPERRDIGMVFQSYALFPHLSARENVAFSLAVRRVRPDERQRRVERMLDRVRLSAAERGRRPAELSGGQQQRVALARALVFEPRLLLLDEPFANLDRRLRERLRAELLELQRETGVTAILVTHDQDEALSLADEVALMLCGRFLQHDAPTALYRRPRTQLAARLVGDANLLEVEAVEQGSVRLQGGFRLPREPGPEPKVGSRVLLRPESCRLARGAEPGTRPARVVAQQYLGADRLIAVELAGGIALRVRVRPQELAELPLHAEVHVRIEPAQAWLIPDADPSWAVLPAERDAG